MGDVLTPDEREALDLARRLTDDKDGGSIFAHEAALVRMIDRLVSEVERLRARNEALEQVAKHVAEWARGRARLEDEADEQGGEEHHAIARKLDAALENTDA